MMTFSIQECLRFGWETFKKRPWFFIGVFLVVTVITNFQFQVEQTQPLTPEMLFGLVALSVAFGVVSTFVRMGSAQFLLRAHESPESVGWKDLWAPHPFWKFLGVTILYGLIVVAGLILLIIPGIIWSVKYQFAPYILMERNTGVIDALRESGRMTAGSKGQLLLFALACMGLVVLGLLCLIVGVLVAIPVTMLAHVHVYKILQRSGDSAARL